MYNMQMNNKKSVTICDSVFAQIVDDEMVLMHKGSGDYFGLDTVGAKMWQLLQENGSLEHLKQEMLACYDVQERELEADIENFVTALVQHGLVRVEST